MGKFIKIVDVIRDDSASADYMIFKCPGRPKIGVRKHSEFQYLYEIEDGILNFDANPFNIRDRLVTEWDGQLLSNCEGFIEYLELSAELMVHFLAFDPVCFQISMIETEDNPVKFSKIQLINKYGSFLKERAFYARESQRITRERETVGTLLQRLEQFEMEELDVQPLNFFENPLDAGAVAVLSDIRNPQATDYTPILDFSEVNELNFITLPPGWVLVKNISTSVLHISSISPWPAIIF
jgi:hypothetical protein